MAVPLGNSKEFQCNKHVVPSTGCEQCRSSPSTTDGLARGSGDRGTGTGAGEHGRVGELRQWLCVESPRAYGRLLGESLGAEEHIIDIGMSVLQKVSPARRVDDRDSTAYTVPSCFHGVEVLMLLRDCTARCS
jgi:hypothetical protein